MENFEVYQVYKLDIDGTDVDEFGDRLPENHIFSFIVTDKGGEYIFADGEESIGLDADSVNQMVNMIKSGDNPPTSTDDWAKIFGSNLGYSEIVLDPDSLPYYDEAVSWEKDHLNIAKEMRDEQEKRIKDFYASRNSQTAVIAAAGASCPPATQDIAINLKNRENAIQTAAYGPLNPARPNDEFWQKKAERWSTDVAEAKSSRCGNCAVFIKTPKMLDCIESGLGNEQGNDAWGAIDAGDLGYCEAFDFKCAAARTCDAWVAGGPVTVEKEEKNG